MEPSSAILIVDDHKLFAEAITSSLRAAGIEVLPVAATGGQALAEARKARPRLVLMDIGLPDESGLAIGRRMLDELPGVRIIALTALNDQQVAAEALRLGFSGFLTKDTPVAEFVNAIKSALAGSAVLSANLKPVANGHGHENVEASFLGDQLTPRERDVLGLLVEGASSPSIAETLSISPNTLRSHIQNILSKLQAHTRLEAAAIATKYEILRRKPLGD